MILILPFPSLSFLTLSHVYDPEYYKRQNIEVSFIVKSGQVWISYCRRTINQILNMFIWTVSRYLDRYRLVTSTVLDNYHQIFETVIQTFLKIVFFGSFWLNLFSPLFKNLFSFPCNRTFESSYFWNTYKLFCRTIKVVLHSFRTERLCFRLRVFLLDQSSFLSSYSTFIRLITSFSTDSLPFVTLSC